MLMRAIFTKDYKNYDFQSYPVEATGLAKQLEGQTFWFTIRQTQIT